MSNGCDGQEKKLVPALAWIAALIGLAVATLVGCGEALDDRDPEVVGDAGVELGQTGQAISAKFSPTFTWATGKDSARTKAQVAGPGGIVPDTATLRYTYSGSQGSFPNDWQFEVDRAFLDIKTTLDNAGSHNWFFVKKTDGTHRITFQLGTCSGNAATSNNMETFVCVSWPDSSSLVDLTESLPGVYQKWTGQAVVKIDQAKISTRCGSTALECRHQLQEHGIHGALWKLMGGGAYAANIPVTTWSSSAVTHAGSGSAAYDFGGLAAGEVCMARSFSVINGTLYTQASGSCTDI